MTCTYCRLEGHRARRCPTRRLERDTARLAAAVTRFAGELLELRLTVLES